MEEYFIEITEDELDDLSSISEFKNFFNTLTDMHELIDVEPLKEYLLSTNRMDCYLIVKNYENKQQ